MTTPCVMIATPAIDGKVWCGFAESLVETHFELGKRGVGCKWFFLAGESLITRARNTCIAHFMALPQFTHLLFIDADIEWRGYEVVKLLEANRGVVCGVYPKKADGAGFVYTPLEEPVRDGNLMTVAHAGTGFMMIKRRILERMREEYPALDPNGNAFWRTQSAIDPNYGVAFAQGYRPYMMEALVNGRDGFKAHHLSEDWAFCEAVLMDPSEKIWVDTTIQLSHHGGKEYFADFAAYLAENEARKAA